MQPFIPINAISDTKNDPKDKTHHIAVTGMKEPRLFKIKFDTDRSKDSLINELNQAIEAEKAKYKQNANYAVDIVDKFLKSDSKDNMHDFAVALSALNGMDLISLEKRIRSGSYEHSNSDGSSPTQSANLNFVAYFITPINKKSISVFDLAKTAKKGHKKSSIYFNSSEDLGQN